MDRKKIYDVGIIGAGPAGLTAAIYCLRDNKNILLIEKEIWGGQINNSPRVNNIPGFSLISGSEFVEKLEEQVRSIKSGSLSEIYAEAIKVTREDENFYIKCDDGNSYVARSIIFATGTKHRLLNVPGEADLIGNGLSFCSICDAPFCKEHDVAVIGGGNTALVEAIELSNFANKVFIVQNLGSLTAEASLVDSVYEIPNIEIITHASVTDFEKNDKITVWYTTGDSVEKNIVVDNVFLAVGLIPQNECAASLLKLNYNGYIENGDVGIGVAGDCRVKDVRQVVTACGDGAAEAIRICKYLNNFK